MLPRLAFALVFLLAAFRPAPAAASNSVSAELRKETFQAVWETVRDRYFDPSFGGLDWDAVRRETEADAIAAPSDEAFYEALQRMVDRLGQSHFSVLPPFWVSTDHLSRKGAASAGVEFIEIDRQVLVWRTREPMSAAGLRPGCALLEVDGTSLRALRDRMRKESADRPAGAHFYREAVEALLSGPSGGAVKVRYSCGDSKELTAELPLRYSQAERSESFGFMPGMETEFEVKPLPGSIVAIRFNLFVTSLMPRIREAITQAAASGARGLIFDIRGNPGGIGAMANGIAGYLVNEQSNIGVMKLRGAELKFIAFPQQGAFTGPVAVIVDRNSASTSEIFAAGLQEMGRAIVVGERSMGAALPSYIVSLPGGALLQFAAADFVTPKGFRIEGKGVTPDVRVAVTAKSLLAGEDAPLEAARAALAAKTEPTRHSGGEPIIVTGN